MTSEQLFKDFLSIVRKERTAIVRPQLFNQWTRMATINWIKEKLPNIEFNQKRIDDLEAIHVITDGVQAGRIYGISNRFKKPVDYFHGLSASFLMCNVIECPEPVPTDPLPSTEQEIAAINYCVTKRVPGKILRADKRVVIDENPYRVPDGTFVYFDLRGGYLNVKSAGENYNCLELEYYKMPDFIIFDPDNTSNNSVGSFNDTQNQEIVELAARKYLERVQDVRYWAYAGEQTSTPT